MDQTGPQAQFMFEIIAAMTKVCGKLALGQRHDAAILNATEQLKFQNCMQKATALISKSQS